MTKITNAKTEASEIAYTTKRPVPGMAVYKDVYIQLVDTPSLSEDPYRSTAIDRQVATLIRNADGVIIVLDALNNPVNQFYLLEEKLKKSGFEIVECRYFVNSPISYFFFRLTTINNVFFVLTTFAYPLCFLSDRLFGVSEGGMYIACKAKKIRHMRA